MSHSCMFDILNSLKKWLKNDTKRYKSMAGNSSFVLHVKIHEMSHICCAMAKNMAAVH